MKLNTVFLILLLILSIKTESKLDQYSINTFMDYLKKNDLFEIIQSIKNTYGQDIAIIACEELNEKNKGNCKKLVTEYMENADVPTPGQISNPKPALKKINCTIELNLSPYMKHSNPNSALKEILRRKFNEIQTNLIYEKIIQKIL